MRTPKKTLILSCVVMVALGVLISSLGPVLPDLQVNTGGSLESMGVVFTALFLGGFCSQIISGTLTDKIGPRPILMGGIFVLAFGMIGISFANSVLVLIVFGVIAGLGHGAVNMSVNLLAAKVFQDRSVAALNLVNFFYGVGAVSGPAIASLFLRVGNSGIPAMWIGSGALLAAFPFVAAFLLSPVESTSKESQTQTNKFLLSPILWIIGLFLFMYVGTENGVGGWTAIYMQRTTTYPVETSALIVSGYWLALTIGRLVVALIGSRWSPARLLAISLIGAFLGALLMAISTGNAVLSLISVLIVGLFFGPIYPTTFSMATSIFNQSAGKFAGIFVAMACLGGMAIPPVQGILLERVSPNSSVWLVAACSLAMVILFASFTHQTRIESQDAAEEIPEPLI